MVSYQVRPAQIEDAHGIAVVHVHTWQQAYVGQIPEDYLRSLSISERTQRWQRDLEQPQPNTQTLVALADRIIGFCSIGPSRDEDADPDTREIYAIYVDPQYMDQGVGSALLTASLEALGQEECKEVTLWVLATNASAQRFYVRHGFVPDGKTKAEPIRGFTLDEIRYRSSPG